MILLHFVLRRTFLASFAFRLSDENINGPEDPASEETREFFPIGFI